MDAPASTRTEISREDPHAFEFTGTGSEFFRIWIVNVLLSILTLGIYSAWATVRTRRYFYGNTRVMGSNFEFHASPLTILKGRLVAIAIFATFIGLGSVNPALQAIMFPVLALAAPFFIVRARMFNAANSSWRNIRFGFERNYGTAYGVYLLMPLLIPLTLGLIYPYIAYARNRFLVDNSLFGRHHFQFRGTGGGFYQRLIGVFFLGVLAFFGFAAFVMVLMNTVDWSSASEGELSGAASVAIKVITVTFYVALFILGVIGRTVILNYVWCNVWIRNGCFSSQLGVGRMVWITLSNVLLIVCTLGLFTPWARTRMARYRAACTSVDIDEASVGDLTAAEQQDASALGDEAIDIFGVEIGAV